MSFYRVGTVGCTVLQPNLSLTSKSFLSESKSPASCVSENAERRGGANVYHVRARRAVLSHANVTTGDRAIGSRNEKRVELAVMYPAQSTQ